MDCGEMQSKAGARGPTIVHVLHVESTEPGKLPGACAFQCPLCAARPP